MGAVQPQTQDWSSVTAAMASSVSADFFENGTNKQFEWVLSKYQEALQAKADGKPGKAEALLKLDKWYQNDLPKKIKSRGKDGHLTHEELVQTIKWKLARGVFRPRLKDLIQMNTPRIVIQESKKAFRAIFKRNDLESAVGALSNLKGVGPAMASAVLAAGCPELAPFMADECLLSMEGTEGIDYTMKEYMKLVAKTQQCVERLNEQGGDWTPHKVEMAVWTHYVARDLKPELLDDMPSKHENKVDRFNGDSNSMTGVAVNGEVSSEEDTTESTVSTETETPVEAEPIKNGIDVSEESSDAVSNGEVTEEAAVVREVSEEAPEAVSCEASPVNGVEESSEVPTEASAVSEVPVDVSTNVTHNGNNGSAAWEEAAAVKNGDHDRVKITQETVEPVVAAAATTVSATTKRPLEDAAEVETATPDMKRARESLETKEAVVEEPTEVNRPDSSSNPVSPPSMATQEVAAVVTNPQPIHTGGD